MREKIAELIGKVEKATGPDRDLDAEIVRTLAPGATVGTYIVGDDGDVVCPAYTASLDAALALAEKLLPGVFWHVAKGRLTDAEPLFAAALFFGADEELGHGESLTAPLAIILATLRALAAQNTETKP